MKQRWQSPLQLGITFASLVLAFSPEARKASRDLLVKGTATLLTIVGQAKEVTLTTGNQFESMMEEAKSEQNNIQKLS